MRFSLVTPISAPAETPLLVSCGARNVDKTCRVTGCPLGSPCFGVKSNDDAALGVDAPESPWNGSRPRASVDNGFDALG